jgi:thiol-disulfide isomerase/thioredoxin
MSILVGGQPILSPVHFPSSTSSRRGVVIAHHSSPRSPGRGGECGPLPPRSSGSTACAALCVAVVVVLVLHLVSSSTRARGGGVGDHALLVSSRRAALADRHVPAEAKKELASALNVTNVTPCTSDACADYKSLSEESKEVSSKALRDFVATHSDCVLMVYAPWCPHCHTAMPHFVTASKRLSTPLGIVNAEMVTKETLSGPNAVCQVTHFPFVVSVRTGKVMDGAVNEDAVVDFVGKEAAATGVGSAPSAGVGGGGSASSNPLDLLFA